MRVSIVGTNLGINHPKYIESATREPIRAGGIDGGVHGANGATG